jgi:hypothetical protein
MGQRRRVNFAGNTVEVEDADIISSNEMFNEYELADGTVVKVKGVLTSLSSIVGQTSPDGTPIYLAALSPVVAVVRKNV